MSVVLVSSGADFAPTAPRIDLERLCDCVDAVPLRVVRSADYSPMNV
jgi:hypothetical protein